MSANGKPLSRRSLCDQTTRRVVLVRLPESRATPGGMSATKALTIPSCGASKIIFFHAERGSPPTTTAKAAGAKRGSSNLGDQVLALATGKTQQEIAAACKGARPNHVGAALSRHKRAGRIEEREGKLYAIQSTSTDRALILG